MRKLGQIGFIWGIGGILLLLVDALFRLTPIAVEAFSDTLTPLHWSFVFSWTVLLLVVEGYRGFHRSFSPRVVARALYLLERPRWRDVFLAPFFCMSLYRTTRRRLIATWGMTFGIISLIVMVRSLDQPWRGLVDLGVVAALICGIVSTVFWLLHGLRGGKMPFSPELGEPMDESERGARGLSQAPTS